MNIGNDKRSAALGQTRAGRDANRRRLRWGLGGLIAALVLLGSFYLVLDQAMQRARAHWATTGERSGTVDPCVAGSVRQPPPACARLSTQQ